MPPVFVSAAGFVFMLALLVGVHLLVAKVVRRVLGPGSRALPATAGALAGYLSCVLLFLAATLGIGRQEATLRVKVLSPGPAHEAGMRDGDRVLFVDGIHPATFDDLRVAVQDGGGEALDIEVQRGAETLRFEVRPRDGRIGVMSIIERHEIPLAFAVPGAIVAPQLAIFRWVGERLALLARSAMPRLVNMTGPVGIREPDPSPWPIVLRLAELGSLAWPPAMFIAFFRGLRS